MRVFQSQRVCVCVKRIDTGTKAMERERWSRTVRALTNNCKTHGQHGVRHLHSEQMKPKLVGHIGKMAGRACVVNRTDHIWISPPLKKIYVFPFR